MLTVGIVMARTFWIIANARNNVASRTQGHSKAKKHLMDALMKDGLGDRGVAPDSSVGASTLRPTSAALEHSSPGIPRATGIRWRDGARRTGMER